VHSHVFNHGVVLRDFCQPRDKKIQPEQDPSDSDGGFFHEFLPEQKLAFSYVGQPDASARCLMKASKLLNF
jgi:hypothetical protein